jgi:hypothetical protein
VCDAQPALQRKAREVALVAAYREQEKERTLLIFAKLGLRPLAMRRTSWRRRSTADVQ